MPCFSATAMIGFMSQTNPYKCTGTIALVRGVTAFSIKYGSMLESFSLISQNTGLAPVRTIDSAVAIKVQTEVITSSPGPMPQALSARNSASVQEFTPTVYGHLRRKENSFSKEANSG